MELCFPVKCSADFQTILWLGTNKCRTFTSWYVYSNSSYAHMSQNAKLV